MKSVSDLKRQAQNHDFLVFGGEMVGASRWQTLLEEWARQYMPVCGEANTVSLSGVLERLKLVRLVNSRSTSTTVAIYSCQMPISDLI